MFFLIAAIVIVVVGVCVAVFAPAFVNPPVITGQSITAPAEPGGGLPSWVAQADSTFVHIDEPKFISPVDSLILSEGAENMLYETDYPADVYDEVFSDFEEAFPAEHELAPDPDEEIAPYPGGNADTTGSTGMTDVFSRF